MAEVSKIDENSRGSLTAVSNIDPNAIVKLYADPVTHRLLVDGSAGGGTQRFIFVTVGDADADYPVADYANVGAAINQAYADLPSTGGVIFVNGGDYTYTTPIVFNTAFKQVQLRGEPAGATILRYTGAANSNALQYNVQKEISAGHGLVDLTFIGASSKGTTCGILLGGLGADDGKGAAGIMLRNVDVSGFGCNICTGNNVYLMTLDNCVSNFGGKLLYEKGNAGAGSTSWNTNGTNTANSGENMRVINTTLADSDNTLFGESPARYGVHLQVSGLTDWNFIGSSFDDVELYIDYTGGSGNQVHLIGAHFENPAADSITKYSFITTLSASTTTSLDLVDTTFVQDANASKPDQLINAGCQVSMYGCNATANAGAGTVGKFVNFQNADNTNNLRFSGNTNLNACVTYLANTLVMTGGAGVINGSDIYSYITGAGVLISKNFNTILDASTFSGSDYGAKINAAYAYISTLGFKAAIITVPAGTFSYSTPIVFGTDGVRVSLRGAPGGGTTLSFTGGASTIACTVNTGIQATGIDHTSYEAIRDITFQGNRTSSTTPEIGVFLGGTHGAAGAVLANVNIQGFGRGLELGANSYHVLFDSGVIRNCATLFYADTPSNSGEAVHFHNAFLVDPFDATYSTTDGIYLENSSVSSLVFTACSIDDCSIHIKQACDVTFIGTHWENPGSANWGAYTYVVIDNNLATNVSFTGDVFYATGSVSPTAYMSNGGNVTMNGVIVRKFTGSTMTNFASLSGSGRISWMGFNNVSGTAITNVVSGVPYTPMGFVNQAGNFWTLDASAVMLATNSVLTNPSITTKIFPTSNDGAPLGDTTHQFSDLFLAEGGVINWDNGDATLTQVGDVVTLAGADLKITTPGTAATSVATIDGTQTLTNKRRTRRLTTTNAPGATPTTNTDNVDIMNFTGLNTAITSMTTNLSGTPVDGDLLEFRFLDDGTARGITWGATFASTTVTLPTTTVISTCLRVGFEWRAASSKWECISTC